MTALKNQWHEQRQQRQQELLERQQQVRDTLTTYQQERQAKAAQLRDDLSLFQSKLQQQTAEFLSACTADRSLMAQQLSQELNHFHSQLTASVVALRQGLQSKIRELQVETRMMLKLNQEQRIQTQMQLAKDLALFIDNLRSDVQSYLSELELVRQDRAHKLQTMLQQDREQRTAEMERLFQEFSIFRAELHQYCVDLRALVWGTEGSSQPPVSQPQPVKAAQPAFTPQPKATPKVAEPAVAPAQPAIATAPPAEPAPTVDASAEPTPSVAQTEPLTVITSNSNPKPVQKDSAQLEKEIYNHIHQVQGARLTELETALDINRFQAVDALRSLIKKGLITQRDRIYLIQEEVSL
ncbi:MAG TPA: hypothetical protein V6C78_28540 [Crinalium sp.]